MNTNLNYVRDEIDLRERLVPVCVGGDILAYSYVRSFHELYGISSIVLSGVDVKVTSSSSFCDYRILDGVDEPDFLLSYLADLGAEIEAVGKIGLLVGLADWHARFLSSNKDYLENWFVVPYIDFNLMDEITHKERFNAICEELGIPYPTTELVNCKEQQGSLDYASYKYPLIMKPSKSAVYDLLTFPGKKKIFEIYSAEEFERDVRAVGNSGYEYPMIVQEFVPGPDDALRSLTTFSNAQGEIRVVSGGRVVLQDHSPLLLGNPVCILGEKTDQIIEDAQKFLKHVGYRGYANFDIKYDERDGSYKFFEINTRPGRNTFYVSLGGVNFVTPIINEFILGKETPYQEAFDPFVYQLIPPYVVKRSVEDEELREQVLAMYKQGLAKSPHDYEPDSLAHKVWTKIQWLNMIPKFKKYMWDTGGKQVDVI